MINFVKHDKYISYINIIIVLVFLFTNANYLWFLVIALTIISLYLIFMIFRFFLRSRVTHDDYMKLKELSKFDFKYDDYSDVYEEEVQFDLEIQEFKELLDSVLINFFRMDRRLNIENYAYIDNGLDILKDSIKKNNVRKQNYELVNDSVNIIKKYYDKKCNRIDSIKNYKKFFILLIILTVISLSFLIGYIFIKKITLFSIILSVYIVILFIVAFIFSSLNKEA